MPTSSPTTIPLTKIKEDHMWYFTWMLGLAMAILFAVVNALWHEFHE